MVWHLFLCECQKWCVNLLSFFFLNPLRTGSHHLPAMLTDWNSRLEYKDLMSWRYVDFLASTLCFFKQYAPSVVSIMFWIHQTYYGFVLCFNCTCHPKFRRRPELSSTSWIKLQSSGSFKGALWKSLMLKGRFWIFTSWIRYLHFLFFFENDKSLANIWIWNFHFIRRIIGPHTF